MTPRFFSSSVSVASLFSTPRGLKEPVRWKSSALNRMSAPTWSESVAERSSGERNQCTGRRHVGDRTSGTALDVLLEGSRVLLVLALAAARQQEGRRGREQEGQSSSHSGPSCLAGPAVFSAA